MQLFQLLFLSFALLQSFVIGMKDVGYAQQFMDENNLVQVNGKNYHELRKGIKDHWAIVLFSAKHIDPTKGSCEICDHFAVVMANVAKYVNKYDPGTKALFYFVDLPETLSAVRDFDFTFVPHLYVFPPPPRKTIWKDQDKLFYNLDFENSMNEWKFAEFLDDYIELPMNEMAEDLSRDFIVVETPESLKDKIEPTSRNLNSMKNKNIKKRPKHSSTIAKSNKVKKAVTHSTVMHSPDTAQAADMHDHSTKPVKSGKKVRSKRNSKSKSASSSKSSSKPSSKSSSKSLVNKFTVPSVDEPIESFKNSHNKETLSTFVSSFSQNAPVVGEPSKHSLRKDKRDPEIDVGSFSTIKSKNKPSIDIKNHATGEQQQASQQQQSQEQQQAPQQKDVLEDQNGVAITYNPKLLQPMAAKDYLLVVAEYSKTIAIAVVIYFVYDKFLFKLF
ncbi:hypothetical protein TPHA_0N01750 [Tetrapisispora phaffii CBS 4417]|uniref:Thioredoxin domain-containing protein n=1 Tax=Tetrapisispora phaffii (strain ATCC 24235 / CBS 4417 / NBRC 1672 / NRRL Y-8282 / UCD 70-5) TaxID=1071381 RepID=G8C1C8_TETPH|nr:hypothetical protein TPHA_0N01750 [Tetrapisispora phaffii CBS 4417]CCE65956.1 hypothetical protein TPHA_0N01750 [Tetrapisispora phaffii CBS 4417]